MTIQLLVTSEMYPIPEAIKIVEDYDTLIVKFGEEYDLAGRHLILEGEPTEFISWLKKFDGIAVGSGIPMQEKFEIMHIKDELYAGN